MWGHNILKAKKKISREKISGHVWTRPYATKYVCHVAESKSIISSLTFCFFFSVVSFQLQIAVEIMSRPMARLKKSQQPVTIQSVITLEVG